MGNDGFHPVSRLSDSLNALEERTAVVKVGKFKICPNLPEDSWEQNKLKL
jgi:hypothetical protein